MVGITNIIKNQAFILLVAMVLVGCATSPEEIPAASISHIQYRDYSCDDIALELDRVSRSMNTLHHQLDKKASNDATQMGVGLFLLWPTLFFLEGGDGPQAMEYAQLKGEFEALEKVAIRKKCAVSILKP